MVFEVKFSDFDIFTKVINSAAQVLDKATLRLDPNGIKLRNMDEGHLVLVDFSIPSEGNGIVEFKCDKEYTITLDMDDLRRVIQRARKDDTITIKLDDKNNLVQFSYEGVSKKQFSLSLLNTDEDLFEGAELNVDLRVSCDIPGGSLGEFLKDASIVGSDITMTAKKDVLSFKSEKIDVGLNYELKKDPEGTFNIEIKGENEEITSTYSYELFKNLVYLDNVSSSVHLTFDGGTPMILKYKLGTDVDIGFLLAPIEEGDEDLEDDEDYLTDKEKDPYADDDEEFEY